MFPAAVERDILIAIAVRDDPDPGRVTADNMDSRYSRQTFAPELENGRWHLDIDKTQLRWESYVKAGYYGVLNRFFDPAKVDPCVPGLTCSLAATSSTAAQVGH